MISDIARVIPEKKFEKKRGTTGVNGIYVLADSQLFVYKNGLLIKLFCVLSDFDETW